LAARGEGAAGAASNRLVDGVSAAEWAEPMTGFRRRPSESEIESPTAGQANSLGMRPPNETASNLIIDRPR